MADVDKVLSRFRVEPGKKFRLKDHDPSWEGDRDIPEQERREVAASLLTQDTAELAKAQELLYAADSWSVLAIFQAMDAAGKDGTIKHVMSGVNPQGCQVSSYKRPSDEELDHDFLWRYARGLPERGRIGIFNRSYYEEVLVVRVHPELLAAQRIPGADPDDPDFWGDRMEGINAYERHLVRNGTRIVKFFLNVSKEEQRKRFLKRLDDPEKNWKFSMGDVEERRRWDDYMDAYQEMIRATSTKWAPWHVIPADHKWVARSAVAAILCRAIRDLKLKHPVVAGDKKAELGRARETLEGEGG